MRRIGRYLLLSVMAVWMICMHTAVVYATYAPVTAKIPVQLNLVGEADDPEATYLFVLTANSHLDPMPSGSANGVSVMEMRGAGETSFSIAYGHPGIYRYQVTQRPGTDENCQYGNDVYDVTVYVTNGLTDTSTLDVSVKAERVGSNNGKSVIEFSNVYFASGYTNTSSGTDTTDTMESLTETEMQEEIFGPTDAPKTGDDTDLVFYQAMLYGSLIMLIIIFLTHRRRASR